jgi:hypothetical protein
MSSSGASRKAAWSQAAPGGRSALVVGRPAMDRDERLCFGVTGDAGVVLDAAGTVGWSAEEPRREVLLVARVALDEAEGRS